jgi:signal transduction histidine kinase
MTSGDLAQKMFTLVIDQRQNKQFFSIKKQLLDQNKEMLQIIDISYELMCHRMNGEKKLLSLINATVSHEMRNPLNSIQSQILRQK